MNAAKRQGQRGVTLIELMIVVVVASILVGIAYPGYQQFVQRSRRSEAQIALTQIAAAQEKFFTFCSTYSQNIDPAFMIPSAVNCAAAGTSSSRNSDDNNYLITAGPGTNAGDTIANSFQLTATIVATGKQKNDSKCATTTLSSRGQKSAASSGGANTTSECWRK